MKEQTQEEQKQLKGRYLLTYSWDTSSQKPFNAVMGCRFISRQLMSNSLEASTFNITILQVHQLHNITMKVLTNSTSSCNEESTKDIIVVQGGWIPNIVEKATRDWQEIIGQMIVTAQIT